MLECCSCETDKFRRKWKTFDTRKKYIYIYIVGVGFYGFRNNKYTCTEVRYVKYKRFVGGINIFRTWKYWKRFVEITKGSRKKKKKKTKRFSGFSKNSNGNAHSVCSITNKLIRTFFKRKRDAFPIRRTCFSKPNEQLTSRCLEAFAPVWLDLLKNINRQIVFSDFGWRVTECRRGKNWNDAHNAM